MTNETKRSNSGDRLISGIDNIDTVRGKLKKAFDLIYSVGQQEFGLWAKTPEDGGYFNCPRTYGWLISISTNGRWQIVYVDYAGTSATVISELGSRELPAHLVMSAYDNLGLLIDGLVERFPKIRRGLRPFFEAAGE